jgi:glycosyltransferase involved in cell wall biosynthesis
MPVVTLVMGSLSLTRQLAATLQKRGMLRRIHSCGPDLEIFDPDGSESLTLIHRYAYYRLANRIIWGVWRRLPGANMARTLPVILTTTVADRLAARWIPACTIYHGCNCLALSSLQVARQRGAITLVENAAMHPHDWQRAVLTECEAFGIRRRDCCSILPAPLIDRMMREFEICDHIVVPSEMARRSFEGQGYGHKAIVVHLGVDHRLFVPAAVPPPRQPFRVCYAGRVEIAKGVPYLLQAWEQLKLPNAELVMIGNISHDIKPLLKRTVLPNVKYAGALPPAQVAEWYQKSHLLAFPSVNEGLARVLLESMSCGLPVVATDLSGAKDCVTPGVDGTIVPARAPQALAEAILFHYNNPESTVVMGKAARTKIEQHFTVEHYVERCIGVYCSLVGSESAKTQRDAVGSRAQSAGAIDGSRAGSAPTPIS